MIPALPPLTRDEADFFQGEKDGVARAAAVNVSPSRSGVSGATVLDLWSDGRSSDRIPDGWNPDGICWTPFCCTPAHSQPIDCGDDCGEGFELTPNPHAPSGPRCKNTTKPFLIEVDEFENACVREDMAQYARENLRRWTAVHAAFYGHREMRREAVDVSGGVAVDPATGFDLLYENRKIGGAIWVPREATARLKAAGVTSLSNGRVVDPCGVRVFTGPGMPNLGPDGERPPPGFAWLAISAENVDYAFTDIELHENQNIRSNSKTPHAERFGIVRVDACDVYMVLVALPGQTCPIPGAEA